MAWVRTFIAATVASLTVAGCGLQSASGTVLEASPGSIPHYDSLER